MNSAHKIDEGNLMLAAQRETQGIPPDSVWQPGEDVRPGPRCNPVKIEVGKFYRTRDGRKVGPMEVWSHVSRWDFRSEGYLWKTDGMNYDGPDSPHDIVAEWTDEPELTARLEAGAVERDANHNLVVANGARAKEEHYRAEAAEARSALLKAENERLRAALLQIKARVVGDHYPAWYSSGDITGNRMAIANICDLALAPTAPSERQP